MIYVFPGGGLCNKMRVIASYYKKAKLYETPITILWKKDKHIGCGINDLFSKIEGIDFIDDSTKIDEIVNNFKRKKLFYNETPEIVRNQEQKEELRKNVEKRIAGRAEFCIRTCYKNGEADWSIFEPNITVRKKINSVFPFDDNIVGVHIRRTDQLASIRISPTELFIHAMMDEIKQDNSVRFFLATDEMEEEKFLRWYFGDRIISIPGKSVSRSDATGIQDAVVDLYCLSMCKKIYGSFNSSFTEVAHAWNRKKELVFIDNGRKKIGVPIMQREGIYEWSYEKSVEIVKKFLSFQQMLTFINCMYHSKVKFCRNVSVYRSYFDFMKECKPYNVKKHNLIRIGSKNYGGHVMADLMDSGTVVSFGDYYGEWNYQMAKRGFSVYQYAKEISEPSKPHPNIHFEKIPAYNISGMSKMLDELENDNCILQMDVRGYEWEVLNKISDKELACFQQMVIDFHDLLLENKIEIYIDILKRINKTHQVVHIHYNNNVDMLCFKNFMLANVIRLTFVRRDVGEFYPATHVYPTPLDNPTDGRKPEVFIGKFEDILAFGEKSDTLVEDALISDNAQWRDLYRDVASDADWLKKKNIYHCSDNASLVYAFPYALCRILDEYRPKNILELNFDKTTKITAQYASSHTSSLTILANDREFVEHFMGC